MKAKRPFYWRKIVGDGKLPNKYFVFHYDQLHKREKQPDGSMLLDMYTEDKGESERCFLGEFKTFAEAIECVNNKSYFPNVLIEDRLTGLLFEQMVIVCPNCGKREYETFQDTAFTKKELNRRGIVFE